MNEMSKNKWIAVVVAIVVTAFFFGGAILYYSMNRDNSGGLMTVGTSTDITTGLPGQTDEELGSNNDLMMGAVAGAGLTNLNNTSMEPVTTKDGLIIQDLEVGTGAEAKAGQQIAVHYVGTLTNGTKFDSSVDRGQPFVFNLGAGQVIKGWDEGFAGMKVGGKRKLTIPPSLGYGAQQVGSIPANSTLIFEVQLLDVK